MELYLRVREREGRLYPDEIVKHLPAVPAGHPLAAEWRARAASCARLTRFVQRAARRMEILDLGCGNGWLAHALALSGRAHVWGVDRGGCELAQAARLFGGVDLCFLQADVFAAPFRASSFDLIVLASVIQYFSDLPALLRQLQGYLRGQGEIHILDSPLYADADIAAARERSRRYFERLGFPEMAASYFHHPVSALAPFSPRWLYDPDSPRARLERRVGLARPLFPWVAVR